MNILILTNPIPFPASSGYPIVVYNTIKGLVEQGSKVTVFSLNTEKQYVNINSLNDPLLEKITLISSSINPNLNSFDAFLNLFTRRLYNISRFFKSGSVAKLRTLLSHNKFDIIQIEGLFVMPYIHIIRQNSRAKLIYRAHNIEHHIYELLASSERSFFRKIYLTLLAKRLYRFELGNLNKTDGILTINQADQWNLKNAGCKVNMENFPVSICIEDYKPVLHLTEHPTVFHLGSMDWLPNIEGLEWFIGSVWDELKKLESGLKFHLAGNNIPACFHEYEDDSIILHENVEDAKAFMNSKSIMVVPLKSGSGMRVKIIEGMAMKKCIISTSLAAEGIRYEHGKNILIADTPDEFYKYILQCTTDYKMCKKIGENARKLVEKDHHINTSSKALIAFYHKLAGA